ncbi:ORF6N domain-containing protein [Pedobacter rhizosphaerae]|uniref:ORF6N domain-containing protein n=1 Tax=Pedobacter rhizosphaerae TaxID=390241 RepID=A0A1H9TSV1_9SPHI|nr:ORF6N domain-containing protein [Pedobacter rhizosphaerae]SES00128.1 ORF6N domain-containing protein [Pedobacter rhizosphaerae]
MAKNKLNLIVPDEVLINKIYFLRNQKVMLDRDLAELYGVLPRRLREQVKRNINNFPNHFMFQLSDTEVEIMISQKAMPSKQYLGGALPYVFTEHGVLMLATVLRSEQAILVSIKIIEIFVRLREMLYDNSELRNAIQKLERKTENNIKNIEIVFKYIDELLEKKEMLEGRERIGYKLSKK